MGSRREEERNEKVIRGLMKLPPNRRCINCNSMGPQYVCTNFWTFVCITCSGIHREFTHRVKSVSMSTFTSQEVDALQAGGNQRAREIYLRIWDLQRQKLPDNSNIEKVRDFIKSVYVDKKYAGESASGKPPRDLQTVQSFDNDDTRRASSYHSYSQSPPYDFQYEDRIYKKQNGSLTRKPGSDRGIYAGKISSFISSPTRFSDDGFANENSGVRLSDYSVSSGGDPSRPGAESPGIFGSPAQHPKRTVSCGSILASSRETNNLNDDLELAAQIPDVTKPPSTVVPSSVDLFEPSVFTASDVHSASTIDLFQLPGAPTLPSETLSHQIQLPSKELATAAIGLTTLPLFPVSGDVNQHMDFLSDKNITAPSAPVNDGWANFDSFQPSTSLNEHNYFVNSPLTTGLAVPDLFGGMPSKESPILWPPAHEIFTPASRIPSDPWKESLEKQIGLVPASTHEWNAFDDASFMSIPKESTQPVTQSKSVMYDPLLASKQHSIDLFPSGTADNVQELSIEEFTVHHPIDDSSFIPTYGDPPMESTKLDEIRHKSTNPFDLPFDSDIESPDMFMDLSTLQAALPDSDSTCFLDSVNQQWFPQDPTEPRGGAAFMSIQPSTIQLGNIKPEGSVVSIGGNPFA